MTIAIYAEVVRGNYGVAAALSTILTVITICSIFVMFKVTGSIIAYLLVWKKRIGYRKGIYR